MRGVGTRARRRRRGLLTRSLPLGAAAALAAALSGCGNHSGQTPVGNPSPNPNAYLRATPAGASRIPVGGIAVVDLTHAARLRPTQLMIAADGTLEHLHWSGWGGASAHADGEMRVLICGRNCVTGHHATYPATVVLSDRVVCAGHRYYNRAEATISTTAGPRAWGSYVHAPCQPQPLVH